jgi:hypothetical protein
MRGDKPSVNKSKKESQHPAALAKGGGKGRMFAAQAAGPAKSGRTGHGETAAPGLKFAQGGGKKMAAYSPAKPVKPGITSPR